jgi:hypothetical protein
MVSESGATGRTGSPLCTSTGTTVPHVDGKDGGGRRRVRHCAKVRQIGLDLDARGAKPGKVATEKATSGAPGTAGTPSSGTLKGRVAQDVSRTPSRDRAADSMRGPSKCSPAAAPLQPLRVVMGMSKLFKASLFNAAPTDPK